MKNWLLNQLTESSTWRGLVWLLTVFGIILNPEQTAAITALGMAIAGALGVFLKDKLEKSSDSKSTGQTPLPPIELVGNAEQPSNAVPFVSGVDPARNRRVTDAWLRDPVPSESGFKHPTQRNEGTVGWNDE